jgi:hypothetical protein
MHSKADAARETRLAAALRENLKRRKAQAKAKAKPQSPSVRTSGTPPQAGFEEQIPVPSPPQSKIR